MLEIGLDSMTMELVIRLLASLGLGALVGLERELTRKPAGLRTHALVSMGACLFTLASLYMLPTEFHTIDYSRIAAGIVTGIGFIGAGTIIAAKGHVKGVTTAASLWIVAAIGLVVGTGNYVLSIIGAVLAFVILRVGKMERELENEFLQKPKEEGMEIKKDGSDGLKIELRLPKGLKLGKDKEKK